jgi:hypothetical protein
MATRSEFEAANRRAKSLERTTPRAVSAHYDRALGRVVIGLNSLVDISFSPRNAQGLERAKPSQLQEIEISPSGFGIYFPKLDTDIYVPALLEGLLGSRQWIAARLGQGGGRSKSPAKKAAARANGRLGGRPRSTARG